jgi:hypothetical protein
MSQDSDPRLAELAAVCKRQRQGGQHTWYDEEAKSLARDLSASGVGSSAIARAAGVSACTIRTWRKRPAGPSPSRRPVRILNVQGDGGVTDGGRAMMSIRVGDFDVTIHSRAGGRS